MQLLRQQLPTALRHGASRAITFVPVPARRFMQVHATSSSEGSKGQDDPVQQQQQQAAPAQQTQGTTAPTARTGPGSALAPAFTDIVGLPAPFRRLSDHMMDMQREMESMMSAFGMPTDPFDMFDRVERSLAPVMPAMERSALRSLTMEVEENDKAYTVHAEVPGFDKDDIKVTLSPDGILTVSGEKNVEERATAEGQEGAKQGKPFTRRYSAFRRSMLLPGDIKAEDIKAAVKNGVLSVEVPKAPMPEDPKPKEIPISTA